MLLVDVSYYMYIYNQLQVSNFVWLTLCLKFCVKIDASVRFDIIDLFLIFTLTRINSNAILLRCSNTTFVITMMLADVI